MSDSSTQMPSDAAPEDPTRSLVRPIIATTAAWTIGYSSIFGQPQLLGPIMRGLEIGEAAAGRLFAFENAAFFITMFLVAGPLARWSRFHAALVGTLVAGIANLLSGFAFSFETLLAARIISGAALGVMAAAGTASAASSSSPSRVFTISSFAWGSATALQQAVIPYALGPYGFAGGYFLLAGICPLLMATFVWLISPHQPAGQNVSMRTAPNRALAICAMASLLIYEIGQSGVFTFLGQIGENSGMSEIATGEVLGWTRFAGLSGGALSIWVGTLAWRKWPVMVGLASNAAAVAALALCSEETLYWFLNLMWTVGYYFVVPLVMATLAKLDKLGRWVVAIDASWNGGTFVGPVVAGWLIESGGGYESLAGMATVAGLISLAIMAGVLRRLSAKAD